MQQLLEEISEIFARYQDKQLNLIPETELVAISNKLSEYLVAVGSKNGNILDLKKEFSVNKFCNGSTNIMHIAAKFSNINHLQGVIEVMGVDQINIIDADFRTPLHHSAIGGATENAIFLMNEGANLNARSSDATRNWLPIHYAVKSGGMELVSNMIERGANPREKTSFGLNCLHIACEFGHVELTEYMLDLGLDIDAPTNYDNLSMCPLHYAAIGNFQKVADLLLHRGANRNKTNDKGYSALDLTVMMNYFELSEFFLERGVASYDLAYEMARLRGNFAIIDLVKKYVTARDTLFTSKHIKSFAPFLEEVLLSYNVQNIEEPRISLFGGARINGCGIVTISKKIGILKKTPTNLIKFAKNNKLKSLAESLEKIQRLTYTKSAGTGIK